jgi:hypothetical protein
MTARSHGAMLATFGRFIHLWHCTLTFSRSLQYGQGYILSVVSGLERKLLLTGETY